MKSILRGSLALAAVLAVSGCDAFDLSGPKLDEDPNIQEVALTPDQYFIGIHSAQALLQEGNLARTVCMWLQHCAGVDRQYASYDVYSVSEDDLSPEWGLVYAQGGLKDIRNLRAISRLQANRNFEGISQVMEAFAIGTAAGIWGDVPYTEALREDISNPALDPQLATYDRLQVLLDSAITNLGAGGPTAADLIYGGNMAAWRQAANTLKARYHMATAEVRGAPAYTAARTAATAGISSPANDFTFYHSSTFTETNVWWQFQIVERDSYLRASATLVDTLRNRGDPRLTNDCASGEEWCAAYFDGTTGSRPGEYALATAANISESRLGPGYDGSYRQPVITWAENQLILAETNFRLGNPAAALAALTAVRAASDRPPTAATLAEIAKEQWMTLFQNIEVWNYWKRNCQPQLTPAPGASSIPGRLLYPLIERNSNTNVPDPSAQPARNPNDPTAC
jgi:hypothetical protein